MDELLHVEVFLDPEDPVAALTPILDHIRPFWRGKQLQYKLVTGGNLNHNFRVWPADSDPGSRDALFLHIFSKVVMTEMIDNYLKVCRLLSRHRFGPVIYCTFTNGSCAEFLHGHDLDPVARGRNHLLDPETRLACARNMARLHSEEMTESARERNIIVNLMYTLPEELLRQFWPVVFGSPRIPESIKQELPSIEVVIQHTNDIYATIKQQNYEIRLCHGDFNPSNMFLCDDGRFTLIDFEGCCLTHVQYDIAYFYLFAFNSHDAPGDKISYPDDVYRTTWCRDYLQYRRELDGDGNTVTDNDIAELSDQVTKVTPAILLRTTFSSAAMASIATDEKKTQTFSKFAILCWNEFKRITGMK